MSAFYTVVSVDINGLDDIRQTSIETLEHDINNCEGFLIVEHTELSAKQQLAAIRQHTNPNVYLKPVIEVAATSSPASTGRFDAFLQENDVSQTSLNDIRSNVLAINRWIGNIPNNDNSLSDTSLRFKALRLIASRKKRLQPRPTIDYKGGFEYGLLTPLFAESDGSVEQVLDFLTSQQLLQPSFVKKAHFCPHCDSAFLNFKETCPDCGSDNIERDELIHHFKCGHTDVIDEFQHHNKMQCPKCDEDLKHIGVDYDKPSTVATCLDCSLTFQEPDVKADCYACHKTSETDDLVLRKINAYTISAIGENAAKFGLDALFTSILQTDLKLYSNDEIKQFLVVEKARIERYKKSQTSLAIIHFTNLEQLFNALGRKTEQVFKEISAVFKAVFRESDLITARNESLFAVVMTETPVESAELAIQRLEQAITGLFESSLEFNVTIQAETLDIMNVSDVESSINAFIEGTGKD